MPATTFLAKEEQTACTPIAPDPRGINPKCELPYGLKPEHVLGAMVEFTDFLQLINLSLGGKSLPRLESICMPANFSSIVGEFMSVGIPKFCPTLAKNTYHNGHPDLVPAGKFRDNSVQHAVDGIEVKASRYLKAWQGHNAEAVFLTVFVFDSNRPVDVAKKIGPKPFRFVKVLGAQLTKEDWLFAGRSATSRRTITASVLPSGFAKMDANWIYKDPRSSAAPTQPEDPAELELE